MYKEKDIDYPGMYPKLDNEKINKILKHCNKFEIYPEICAYYSDMEDFYSDWVYDNNIDSNEEEADERLEYGIDDGEFIVFENWGILRFTI